MPKSIFTPSQTIKLRKLQITFIFDLLLHLPTRYQNQTKIESIKSIVPGTPAQIEGVITQSTVNYGPRKNLIEDEPLPETFSPIYPTTTGLSQKLLCKLIKKSIKKSLEAKAYNDYFPELYSKRKLPLLMDAIEEIHFPSKDSDIELFNQRDNIYHHRLIYGIYHNHHRHL